MCTAEARDKWFNRDKSAVFFSANCTDQMKDEVRGTLHIEKEALAEKYLGLPYCSRKVDQGSI